MGRHHRVSPLLLLKGRLYGAGIAYIELKVSLGLVKVILFLLSILNVEIDLEVLLPLQIGNMGQRCPVEHSLSHFYQLLQSPCISRQLSLLTSITSYHYLLLQKVERKQRSRRFPFCRRFFGVYETAGFFTVSLRKKLELLLPDLLLVNQHLLKKFSQRHRWVFLDQLLQV